MRIICSRVANFGAILLGMINTSVPRSFARPVIHFGLLPMGASPGPGRKARGDDDNDKGDYENGDGESIPHICHQHHQQCWRQNFQAGVKKM